jgi:electron transfer flavoprotein alpha subunit
MPWNGCSERKFVTEICAVLEHTGAALHEHSGELLSELVDISRSQSTPAAVCAVLLVSQQEELPDISLLPKLGIHHLYILEHPRLAHYSTESYVDALAWFIQQHTPMLLVTSATPDGRDWMPRLAAQLHLPFVPNCLSLDIRDDGLFALRAIYEGRAYVQTRTALHGRTALATLVPGVRGTPANIQQDSSSTPALEIGSPSFRVNRRARFIAATADLSARARQSPQRMKSLEITRFVPVIQQHAGQERIRHIAIQAPSPEQVELDAAERIVAGGRGVGREGFTAIAAFARLLDAAVGATRVATDLGWIEHARQIGATGKIVHPKLYIACGISGAAQHTSGMSEAQTVIAINPDRGAPIFALADLGLLGDANQVLPLAAKLLEQS